MAWQKRNVLLLMDQCAAHNSECLTLKHVRLLYLPANTTSYMQPLDHRIIYCMKPAYRRRLVRFLLREIDRDVPAEVRQWNILYVMRGVSMAWESHHVCSNSKLLCEMWLRHCKFKQYRQWWRKLRMGGTERPHWLPWYFEEFLIDDKSVPTTTDQPTSYGPGPSSEHVVGDEEKM
jgi:hypothetical protein